MLQISKKKTVMKIFCVKNTKMSNKIYIRYKERDWLVKFRHIYDPKNMGQMEFRYNETALNCGIHVPKFKLLNTKGICNI